jgi:hypothetical protein
MPDGYALMLNPDEMFFYWLRSDGVEGLQCCDRWMVYDGAMKNKEAGE